MPYPSSRLRPSNHIYPGDVYFITDREESDIQHVRELTEKMRSGTASSLEELEWTGPLRGTFGIFTLNRINAIMMRLKAMYPPIVYPTTPKTDFAYSTKVDVTEVAKVLANVAVIRSLNGHSPSTPQPPSTILNYEQANTVETILREGYKLIKYTQSSYRFCGDTYSE